MSNVLFDSQDDEAVRRERLYAGDLYVYSATPGSRALCELAQQLAEEAFAPHCPTLAQHSLPVDQYIEILKDLKPRFIHHPECKRIIPEMLRELNCDLEQTYFDVPRLRTACAGDYLSTGMAYAFKPHRDTWYSTPMSQLNWWLPVYPIASNNAMAFHPQYWDQPVANTSSQFDYQDWNGSGRQQAAKQSATKDTRFQSAAIDSLQLQPDLRLVCPPGGVILFSAAHLHSTVPNTTDRTRLSIDFRTVDARDIADDRGAVNIDGMSTGTTMMDYRRGTDLQHFADEIIDGEAARTPTPRFPTAESRVVEAIAAEQAAARSAV